LVVGHTTRLVKEIEIIWTVHLTSMHAHHLIAPPSNGHAKISVIIIYWYYPKSNLA
jgi:hypothetical protein